MKHQNLSLCSADDLLGLYAALRNTIRYQLLNEGKWQEIHVSLDELDAIRTSLRRGATLEATLRLDEKRCQV